MVLSFFTGGAGMMSWCRRERFQWNQEVKPLVFANSCVSVRWKFCSMLLLTLSRRPLSEGIKKTIKIMVSFWSGQLRVWLHHETFWYEINRNNAATCKELLPFSLSWTLGMAMQHYGEWEREWDTKNQVYSFSAFLWYSRLCHRKKTPWIPLPFHPASASISSQDIWRRAT